MNKFFKEMISSRSNTSSKRFNGTIGFAIFCSLVIFVVLYDFLKDGVLEDYSLASLETLAWTSAILLGVGGAIEGIKSKLMK